MARFEKNDILRIVRALAIFRPSLIALQMPMTDEDEIFVERCFQRSLMELEKLISYSGTPTVVWRRTGEICLVAPEFCMLTEWPMEEFVGRRKYIYEVTPRSFSTLPHSVHGARTRTGAPPSHAFACPSLSLRFSPLSSPSASPCLCSCLKTSPWSNTGKTLPRTRSKTRPRRCIRTASCSSRPAHRCQQPFVIRSGGTSLICRAS
ncbi:hypothetical protein J3R83DRAFT_4037 [Lanmaoa asiatica]|nr:hypothetical protein J3R83DRAFT_4037 [Lanmaoa asiatica]